MPSASTLAWCLQNGIKVGDEIWFRWNSRRDRGWMRAEVLHFGNRSVMIRIVGRRSKGEYLLEDEETRKPIVSVPSTYQPEEPAHAPGTEVAPGDAPAAVEGTSNPF